MSAWSRSLTFASINVRYKMVQVSSTYSDGCLIQSSQQDQDTRAPNAQTVPILYPCAFYNVLYNVYNLMYTSIFLHAPPSFQFVLLCGSLVCWPSKHRKKAPALGLWSTELIHNWSVRMFECLGGGQRPYFDFFWASIHFHKHWLYIIFAPCRHPCFWRLLVRLVLICVGKSLSVRS